MRLKKIATWFWRFAGLPDLGRFRSCGSKNRRENQGEKPNIRLSYALELDRQNARFRAESVACSGKTHCRCCDSVDFHFDHWRPRVGSRTVRYLEPFNDGTSELEGELNPTISEVYTVWYYLEECIQETDNVALRHAVSQKLVHIW